MRKVSIFGATGSIGQNTLDLIRRRKDEFQIVALTGGRNIDQLARDALEFNAKIAVTSEVGLYQDLKDKLGGRGVEVAAGADALIEAADRPADWIMSAIVGSAGLEPGLRALQHGTTLALANKESLVTAGPLLMETARETGATILPVDSEHSAIFQALVGEDIKSVERVIITASGGAFRDWPIEKLKTASVSDASNHPNWNMGQRITIDSASMFNKALEVIECKEYFGIDAEKIEVLIHPQSMVHALIDFQDGAMMAHLGAPDMRHAIGFALNWPERRPLPVSKLDLAKVGALEFTDPDHARYPALNLAWRVMDMGGLAGTVFNAAKERALDHFISGQIQFTDMALVVGHVLEEMIAVDTVAQTELTLDNIRQMDQVSRMKTDEILTGRKSKKAG